MPNELLINHYNAVRMRVTGTGTLRMELYTLSNERQVVLPNLTMALITERPALKLTI